jgi:hypothetical protein
MPEKQETVQEVPAISDFSGAHCLCGQQCHMWRKLRYLISCQTIESEQEGRKLLLTDISCLLRVFVMRQIVTWDEDRDSAAVLKRQANLVEVVPVPTPEDGQVNRIVRCHGAHKGQLEERQP